LFQSTVSSLQPQEIVETQEYTNITENMSDEEDYEYEYDDDAMDEDQLEYTDEEEGANDSEVALGTSRVACINRCCFPTTCPYLWLSSIPQKTLTTTAKGFVRPICNKLLTLLSKSSFKSKTSSPLRAQRSTVHGHTRA
jgi:hypothetical protein